MTLLSRVDGSEVVSIHHGFDGQGSLLVILGRLLGVVGGEDFSFDEEVDELTHRHAFIDANRLFDRDFQCPMIAEAHVTFASGSVNVDTEATDAGFSFEERNSSVTFCVFHRRAEVIDLWLEDVAFRGNLEVINFIVLPCIKDPIAIRREVLAEVDVVAVGAEAGTVKRLHHDFAPLHGCENFRVGQNHVPRIETDFRVGKSFLQDLSDKSVAGE